MFKVGQDLDMDCYSKDVPIVARDSRRSTAPNTDSFRCRPDD